MYQVALLAAPTTLYLTLDHLLKLLTLQVAMVKIKSYFSLAKVQKEEIHWDPICHLLMQNVDPTGRLHCTSYLVSQHCLQSS